jgi:hypothetical protein
LLAAEFSLHLFPQLWLDSDAFPFVAVGIALGRDTTIGRAVHPGPSEFAAHVGRIDADGLGNGFLRVILAEHTFNGVTRWRVKRL